MLAGLAWASSFESGPCLEDGGKARLAREQEGQDEAQGEGLGEDLPRRLPKSGRLPGRGGVGQELEEPRGGTRA